MWKSGQVPKPEPRRIAEEGQSNSWKEGITSRYRKAKANFYDIWQKKKKNWIL